MDCNFAETGCYSSVLYNVNKLHTNTTLPILGLVCINAEAVKYPLRPEASDRQIWCSKYIANMCCRIFLRSKFISKQNEPSIPPFHKNLLCTPIIHDLYSLHSHPYLPKFLPHYQPTSYMPYLILRATGL